MAALAAPASAAAADSQAVSPSRQLERPPSQTAPPPGHRLSARQAIRIAERSERLRSEVSEHRGYTREAYTKGPGTWQVSYFDRGKEIAQAIVDERTARPTEVWTGPQVAWQMARGLPGAFGRKVNAPYVWIPLMLAFMVPFFDWRRPFRLLHLDLLVLLAFSLSHIWFNKGEIFTSVPLVYPVLAYLLLRMLAVAYVPRLRERTPHRLLVPTSYLLLGLIFLVGFRAGLNMTNSNVIDVGYSGVIGADRLTHGESLYGNFPSDDSAGDTYGPVNYYAYVPFELIFPWSGKWDDLPAAHAAALVFDLATIVALFFAGRRLRRGRAGWDLGVMLAYGWASYPYTLFVLNSNANDSLVALLLVCTFLALQSSRLRGAALALAAAVKFAPLALVPLLTGYARTRRNAIRFLTAFVAVGAIVLLPVVLDGGPRLFWDRTVGFQLGRDSPFSIWGQHDGLDWAHDLFKGLTVALALLVALVPRRKSPVQMAALGAAVLIALEISLTHWFYLYIVWFFPFVLMALLGAARFDGEPEAAVAEEGGVKAPESRSARSTEPALRPSIRPGTP